MEPAPHTIPEELLRELDEANHRFAEAREHLDQAIVSNEFLHQERIDHKTEEFRAAEKALEEITAKIEEAMRSSGKEGQG